MTKRLQVIMSEADMDLLRVTAKSNDVSVGEWVRRAIRQVLDQAPVRSKETKHEALRKALTVNGPTGDIDLMNQEIEAGCLSGLP